MLPCGPCTSEPQHQVKLRMANDNRFTWLDGYELSHVARNDANDNVNDADGGGDDHHLDTVTPHN